MEATNPIRKQLEHAGLGAFFRRRDAEAAGVSAYELEKQLAEGELDRIGRGLYRWQDAEITEHYSLAAVGAYVPDAVFCLLTALSFHEIGTQLPHEVWIALPRNTRKPRLEYPRLRVVRFSGAAMTEGIEIHRLEDVEVRMFSPAKTVADCFKYRNKIGIDVAVEALREFTRKHRGGATELAHYARICRVNRVMQPYLDAIT